MNNVNDLSYFHDECPLLPSISHFDTTDFFPYVTEINALTKKVEQLNIDVNTQRLRVELEKLKRKRLGTTLKRMRQETTPVHRSVMQLQRDYNIIVEVGISEIGNCLKQSQKSI